MNKESDNPQGDEPVNVGQVYYRLITTLERRSLGKTSVHYKEIQKPSVLTVQSRGNPSLSHLKTYCSTRRRRRAFWNSLPKVSPPLALEGTTSFVYVFPSPVVPEGVFALFSPNYVDFINLLHQIRSFYWSFQFVWVNFAVSALDEITYTVPSDDLPKVRHLLFLFSFVA